MSKDTDWGEVEAAFRAEGFLALETDKFRGYFRDVMAEWFSLGHRINALGQRIYVECSDLLPGKRLLDPISLGLQMFPRCLSGFQAVLILAERGLGVEAQSLVRSIFETAFWIGYIGSDPESAVPQLRCETLKSEIGLFEASLLRLKGMKPDVRAEAERQLVEMKREKSALPNPPKVEDMANFAGYGYSYLFYKDLSGVSTHLSLKSIHVFLHHDEQGGCGGPSNRA